MKKIIALSAITTSLLFAAAPNSSSIQNQLEKPRNLPKKSTPLVELKGAKKYKAPMQSESTKKIFVKEFKITGAIHIKEKKLKALIKSYENKELTFAQIQEVASIITKEYRKEGYFVARAYIPVQTIQNDVIEIAIIEGNYGEFKLKNDSLVKDSIVKGMLDNIKEANIISTDTLERAMLIINDTPGVVVSKAEVMPGSKVGTSDFLIETTPSARFDGYVVADNYGSRYTGKSRLSTQVNINSPFNIGDQISLGSLVSNHGNLKNYNLAYNFPLASNGLRGEFAYSHTKYNLVEEYEELDAHGQSNIFDFKIKYPIIKSRVENLDVQLKFSNKNFDDHVNGNQTANKNIKSLTASLLYSKDYVLFDRPSYVNSGFNLTTGRLKNDNSNLYDGRYNKIDFYVNNTISLANTYSLTTGVTAQKVLGGKNLDGSEDMSLGGAYAVKFYPDSEQSAENGYIFNIELFKQLQPINSYTHRVSFFYDIGNVYMEDASTDTTFDRRTLQDAGIGYYANYKDFFARVNLAYNINHEVTAEPNYNSKILVQAGWVF
ncbi:ShlB/FhaC/HecB family hemolysin secretion/activation protein [Arcobacter sp. CECT 8985]|uniref:ShlB/FhaC/HecB family hemolysin secretion/activation protein n=1 Tax=Arcobacter sp. CECT 8985 TaxID=1935424 RepID=UPI00100B0ADA|nr:ShlB/FhaC/HecB family hemolysin secretion/activation protein [Arcobacter sp. CECT 8985]RXJ87207.1 hemin-binding protein [Arcobacter sp. CECT 8985]